MWPEIWRLAEEKIAQAHSDGYKVCVVDAAVMLKAGWQRNMHEVWVTIAPDTEVSPYKCSPTTQCQYTLGQTRQSLHPLNIYLRTHLYYVDMLCVWSRWEANASSPWNLGG